VSAPATPRRRRIGRALAELHIELRTEGETPLRKALSVGLGVVVGCLPLLGLHLPLCAGLARLLRLSRARAYLAAHISNPLSFPFLVYLEIGIGRLISERRWPDLDLGALREEGFSWSAVGRDLTIGSVALGVCLGSLAFAVAYAIGRRWRKPPFRALLDEETSRRYADTGVSHWEFVRAKLHWDPVYHALIEAGTLAGDGLIVDLGCGRGVLLALLAAARDLHRRGRWKEGWPPPGEPGLLGIEVRRKVAAVARVALADAARIQVADLTRFEPPECRAAVLIDVLHYLGRDEQERLIRRAAAALQPGGLLLIREADAGLGWRFGVTRVGERLAALGRGELRRRLCYRTAAEWEALARGAGLEPATRPMSAGTPHGNVLIEARKPAAGPAGGGAERGEGR
jgi:uncharacterized protein (DUF2062 family)